MLNLNIPGIPALPSSLSGVLGAAGSASHLIAVGSNLTNSAGALLGGLGLGDVASALGLGTSATTWAVLDKTGNDALGADTVAGLDYQNSSKLIDYPVEDGGFQSFNKVANPFDVTVVAAVGGTNAKRQVFLARIEAMAASLDVFSVVTPEKTFKSVNLERFDISRKATSGAYLLIANLHFREIRVTASVNGQNNAQTASAAPVASQGQVSPGPITSAITSALSGPAQALKSVQATVTGSAAKLIGVL